MNRLLQTSALVVGLGVGIAPALAESGMSKTDCNTAVEAVDANRDGTVDADEARKAADREFGRLDADGDKAISLGEWRDCGLARYMPEGGGTLANAFGSASWIEEGVSASDPSQEVSGDKKAAAGHGAVDASTDDDDNMTTGSVGTAGSAGSAPAKRGDASAYFGDEFEALDLDRSGDIDSSEAASWAEKSFSDREARGDDSAANGDDTPTPHERAARIGAGAFASMDADGDGTVTKDEWSSQDQSRSDIRFRKYDADGDETLTEEEWRQAMDERYEAVRSIGTPVTVWRFWYVM